MRKLGYLVMCFVLLGLACTAFAQTRPKSLSCDENGALCSEVYDPIGYEGKYTGHDEPSLLFYSNTPGSGNKMVYLLRLPEDPARLPKQDGTGGTFNFQLHPAFWVGVAMCDDQSAPNPGGSAVAGPTINCTPDSDHNIFDGTDPTKPDYIGKHPGAAFMEMQFYPPGWVLWPGGNSCDATQWCAALNIDSVSQNLNTGRFNNSACEAAAGDEYVNFAFITKSGAAHAPASPLLATLATFTPHPTTDLFMNSGDVLRVALQDSYNGLRITIDDLTTGESGSMTASAANGFGEVLYDPDGKDCAPTTHNIATNFHPMYATSSEHTRVPWAAHSYNVAFSDEIGHWEYCNAVSSEGGECIQDGVHDLDNGLPPGAEDDDGCFDAAASSRVQVGGCFSFSTDFDFDGVPYQLVWPGTFGNPRHDRQLHPRSILFTSPLFTNANTSENQNYSRVAFETDLPRIEFATNPPCQRHVSNPADPNPGQGCVNPATGANFYPFFSTRGGEEGGERGEGGDGACAWQLGGANIPGTTNAFGGSSTAEFGPLLKSAYPASNGQVSVRYNNFRQVLSSNPCRASESIESEH
jgi:hypothetical protein